MCNYVTYNRFLWWSNSADGTACHVDAMCNKFDNRWYILQTGYRLKTGLPGYRLPFNKPIYDDDVSVSCAMCWCDVIHKHVYENQQCCKTTTKLTKKLIRRWDDERELSLRRHRTRDTKYNRLVHKFRHSSTRRLCVGTYVYQIQWNNAM